MPPRDALRERWASVAPQLSMANEFLVVLDGEKFGILAAVEATELAVAVPESRPARREDVDSILTSPR